jgi:hypothetical protein
MSNVTAVKPIVESERKKIILESLAEARRNLNKALHEMANVHPVVQETPVYKRLEKAGNIISDDIFTLIHAEWLPSIEMNVDWFRQ